MVLVLALPLALAQTLALALSWCWHWIGIGTCTATSTGAFGGIGIGTSRIDTGTGAGVGSSDGAGAGYRAGTGTGAGDTLPLALALALALSSALALSLLQGNCEDEKLQKKIVTAVWCINLGLPMNLLSSCDYKREKKRIKQRRHRYNKAVKAREQRTAERRLLKVKNTTVFYVPSRREKLKNRNATRRQEYRKFMQKMASDLSKKRGLGKLQGNPHITRKKLLTSSSFKNRMRTLRKENKHRFRAKWKHHKQTFMGITQQAYIVKTHMEKRITQQ